MVRRRAREGRGERDGDGGWETLTLREVFHQEMNLKAEEITTSLLVDGNIKEALDL